MRRQRLERQVQFLLEIDKLKKIVRRSYICEGERRENSAEHSWHTALMVLLLAEYADSPIDPLRAAKMMLIHDLVEIDAGDTFIYDSNVIPTPPSNSKPVKDRQQIGFSRCSPTIRRANSGICGKSSRTAGRWRQNLPKPWTG